MTTDELPVAQLKAELFKALAHPVRVRALEVLVRGECSVTALSDQLGIELSHLSQQLAILRRAQVVVTRREGNTIFYSLRDPRLSQLFAVAKQMLMSKLEDSRDLLITMADMDRLEAHSPLGTALSR